MKSPELTRAEYELTVCARSGQAVCVPFKAVSFPGWLPKVADCHQNADVWVRENPEYEVVRGWVTYACFLGRSAGLTAHSVVRDRNGELVDITPLENESSRAGMRFIPHEGEAVIFDQMKALDIYITCHDFDTAEGAEDFAQEIFYEPGEEE
jgi:hypothetical protein